MIATLFMCVACDNIEEQTNLKYGEIAIDIQHDDEVFVTRALSEGLADYNISIFHDNIMQWTDTYHVFTSSNLFFPAISGYKLSAENCTLEHAETSNAGWGQIRVAGESTSFVISADYPNIVTIICAMQNSKVSVEYQDEFAAQFTDYSVQIYKESSIDRVLSYSSDATMEYPLGYFNIDGANCQINYVLKATLNGVENEYTGSVTIDSAKHYRLIFSLPTLNATRSQVNNLENNEMILLQEILIDPNS